MVPKTKGRNLISTHHYRNSTVSNVIKVQNLHVWAHEVCMSMSMYVAFIFSFSASLFKLALQAKGAWQAPILFDCFKVKKMNR